MGSINSRCSRKESVLLEERGMDSASERRKWSLEIVLHETINKLTPVFHASVLLLIINFVITLSK